MTHYLILILTKIQDMYILFLEHCILSISVKMAFSRVNWGFNKMSLVVIMDTVAYNETQALAIAAQYNVDNADKQMVGFTWQKTINILRFFKKISGYTSSYQDSWPLYVRADMVKPNWTEGASGSSWKKETIGELVDLDDTSGKCMKILSVMVNLLILIGWKVVSNLFKFSHEVIFVNQFLRASKGFVISDFLHTLIVGTVISGPSEKFKLIQYKHMRTPYIHQADKYM